MKITLASLSAFSRFIASRKLVMAVFRFFTRRMANFPVSKEKLARRFPWKFV